MALTQGPDHGQPPNPRPSAACLRRKQEIEDLRGEIATAVAALNNPGSGGGATRNTKPEGWKVDPNGGFEGNPRDPGNPGLRGPGQRAAGGAHPDDPKGSPALKAGHGQAVRSLRQQLAAKQGAYRKAGCS